MMEWRRWWRELWRGSTCGSVHILHYSFLMSQKSSCFAAAWDLAPCPHSQCLFRYVLLMPTKFSCLAAAWDLAPCPHFHYLPNDLLHHQAGDRKGKVSNFRWLRDRKIGSGILSSSARFWWKPLFAFQTLHGWAERLYWCIERVGSGWSPYFIVLSIRAEWKSPFQRVWLFDAFYCKWLERLKQKMWPGSSERRYFARYLCTS